MTPKLVLTGGPCAGKTTCLNAIRQTFGSQILCVPEAATMLLDGGVPPPGDPRILINPTDWVVGFQSAILQLQLRLEHEFQGLAAACGARLVLCDRGVLDGVAYWPEDRNHYLKQFDITLEDCFARYHSIIHLESLAVDHPHAYGTVGNAFRYEALDEARHRERLTRAAWDGHHALRFVPSSTEVSDKIDRVLQIVREAFR